MNRTEAQTFCLKSLIPSPEITHPSQQHRKTIAAWGIQPISFHQIQRDSQVSARLLDLESAKAEEHLGKMRVATNLESH